VRSLTAFICTVMLSLPLVATSSADGLATPKPPAKAGVLRDKLQTRLQKIARDVDGVMAYAVLDLTTGDRFGHLESEVFPTASTIKIAILYELFRRADEGSIDLDEMRALDRRHAVGGSGVLQELGTPSLSLRDYGTLMVTLSDNTATNVLIDALGAEAITKRMAGLGLPATRLRRRMIDLEAARRGDENVSTPAELVRLLQLIHAGDGLTAKRRNELLAILKKPKSSPLRRGTPSTIEVANKPGGLAGVEVDAGLVFVPGRPYVLAVMTTYLRDTQAGARAIEDASRAVYEYFDRIARGGEYGRSLK
jgi:beta-lactamase class A